VKSIVGLMLATTLLLIACYTGPSAGHFVAVVDELDVPAGWQVAETVVRGPDQVERCDPGLSNDCPAAIRTYLVEADVAGAHRQSKDVITGAGFSITDEATSGCSSGSSTGPPCGFFAERGSDHLYVGVFHSPAEAGLENEVPGVVAVMVRAFGSD
jgi:hypothetical protein